MVGAWHRIQPPRVPFAVDNVAGAKDKFGGTITAAMGGKPNFETVVTCEQFPDEFEKSQRLRRHSQPPSGLKLQPIEAKKMVYSTASFDTHACRSRLSDAAAKIRMQAALERAERTAQFEPPYLETFDRLPRRGPCRTPDLERRAGRDPIRHKLIQEFVGTHLILRQWRRIVREWQRDEPGGKRVA